MGNNVISVTLKAAWLLVSDGLIECVSNCWSPGSSPQHRKTNIFVSLDLQREMLRRWAAEWSMVQQENPGPRLLDFSIPLRQVWLLTSCILFGLKWVLIAGKCTLSNWLTDSADLGFSVTWSECRTQSGRMEFYYLSFYLSTNLWLIMFHCVLFYLIPLAEMLWHEGAATMSDRSVKTCTSNMTCCHWFSV